ncbi:hypothetical protein IJ384_02190 [bacterium]|nr:hypothetical protein [bacterium]
MKKYIITFIALLSLSSAVFADDKQDALNFFNTYVENANSYNPAVAEMYSPSAKIIRQVVKPDGTTVNVSTDTATYIKQMKIGQAGAKLRKYKNDYTNISATPYDGGYKISSLRQPSGEDYKLKTYMVVKKQPNGSWLITEELMQTKVQTFLRYAEKN